MYRDWYEQESQVDDELMMHARVIYNYIHRIHRAHFISTTSVLDFLGLLPPYARLKQVFTFRPSLHLVEELQLWNKKQRIYMLR
jgi:hypothetical protein